MGYLYLVTHPSTNSTEQGLTLWVDETCCSPSGISNYDERIFLNF